MFNFVSGRCNTKVHLFNNFYRNLNLHQIHQRFLFRGQKTRKMDLFDRWFSEKLATGLGSSDIRAKPKVLESLNLDGVAEFIKAGKCKNLITMAGAGISTSAGIPDFRTPGNGLYSNLQRFNLPYPEAVFDIEYFNTNPKPFYALAKELFPGNYKPTVCHYFIRLLAEKGLLLRHYTQNVDALERVAGLPADKIVEAHGSLYTSHCVNKDCKQEYSLEWMKETILADKIPTCTACSSLVKPDAVFFGEGLPERFVKMHDRDFPKCDLLLILGTSLVVQPFASLVDRVPPICPRLLINREVAGTRDPVQLIMGLNCGLSFDDVDNFRDVAWLGDCDEGCLLLAEKLGWADELKDLVARESGSFGTG